VLKDFNIDPTDIVPTKAYSGALVSELLDRALPREKIFAKGTWRDHVFNVMVRYNDSFNMFGDQSGVNTRVMRWLRFVTFVLSSMFMCTTFYGQFFPDDGRQCETFTTKETCLDEPSKWSSSVSMCEFNSGDSTCSLRAPPETPIFIAVVGIIVFVLTFFTQIVLWYVFDVYACKRPRLEEMRALRLRANAWLGAGERTTFKGEFDDDDDSAIDKVCTNICICIHTYTCILDVYTHR
jgi:hypothetical protein